MKHPEFLKNIDWKLLREQQQILTELYNTTTTVTEQRALDGIFSLIDAIQDYAIDELGIDEDEVFYLNLEE